MEHDRSLAEELVSGRACVDDIRARRRPPFPLVAGERASSENAATQECGAGAGRRQVRAGGTVSMGVAGPPHSLDRGYESCL